MAPNSQLPARIAQAVALLKPDGTFTRDLCAAMGIPDARVCVVMTAAAAEGKAVLYKAGRNAVYFPTAADADAFAARFVIERAAHVRELSRQQNQRRQQKYGPILNAARNERRRIQNLAAATLRAEQQAIRAAEAEQRKQRQRLEREAAAAHKKRAKAEEKKTMARLQAQTRAAGKIAALKGTASPAPVKVRGPAMLDTPAIIPANVKITRCPDNFHREPKLQGGFSSMRIGEYAPSLPASKWVQELTS